MSLFIAIFFEAGVHLFWCHERSALVSVSPSLISIVQSFQGWRGVCVCVCVWAASVCRQFRNLANPTSHRLLRHNCSEQSPGPRGIAQVSAAPTTATICSRGACSTGVTPVPQGRKAAWEPKTEEQQLLLTVQDDRV